MTPYARKYSAGHSEVIAPGTSSRDMSCSTPQALQQHFVRAVETCVLFERRRALVKQLAKVCEDADDAADDKLEIGIFQYFIEALKETAEISGRNCDAWIDYLSIAAQHASQPALSRSDSRAQARERYGAAGRLMQSFDIHDSEDNNRARLARGMIRELEAQLGAGSHENRREKRDESNADTSALFKRRCALATQLLQVYNVSGLDYEPEIKLFRFIWEHLRRTIEMYAKDGHISVTAAADYCDVLMDRMFAEMEDRPFPSDRELHRKRRRAEQRLIQSGRHEMGEFGYQLATLIIEVISPIFDDLEARSDDEYSEELTETSAGHFPSARELAEIDGPIARDDGEWARRHGLQECRGLLAMHREAGRQHYKHAQRCGGQVKPTMDDNPAAHAFRHGIHLAMQEDPSYERDTLRMSNGMRHFHADRRVRGTFPSAQLPAPERGTWYSPPFGRYHVRHIPRDHNTRSAHDAGRSAPAQEPARSLDGSSSDSGQPGRRPMSRPVHPDAPMSSESLGEQTSTAGPSGSVGGVGLGGDWIDTSGGHGGDAPPSAEMQDKAASMTQIFHDLGLDGIIAEREGKKHRFSKRGGSGRRHKARVAHHDIKEDFEHFFAEPSRSRKVQRHSRGDPSHGDYDSDSDSSSVPLRRH